MQAGANLLLQIPPNSTCVNHSDLWKDKNIIEGKWMSSVYLLLFQNNKAKLLLENKKEYLGTTIREWMAKHKINNYQLDLSWFPINISWKNLDSTPIETPII